MKYLFVIYTDLEYKKYLDHFKSQEFYGQICDDPNIEVIEWGDDFHTDYRDLPIKTQQMMKWCGENKEYDYLIKCDDTVFNDKWVHYRDKLVYDNIFKNDDIEYSWVWARWIKNFRNTLPLLSSLFSDQDLFSKCINICKSYEQRGNLARDELKYYKKFDPTGFKVEEMLLGAWIKREKINNYYRGINYLPMMFPKIWEIYFKEHYDGDDKIDYDLDFIDSTIQFYEGKFYIVSKELSIFIGGQEKFAKDMAKNMPGVEDLMIGYFAKLF